MSAKRHLAVLRRLSAQGSLAESACSRSFLTIISSLVNGGVVAWEKSGAGKRLAVRDSLAFAHFLARHFPKGETEVATAALRVQGAARFRDTKALRGTGEEIICVRGWHNGALLCKGEPVSIIELTQNYGLMAFLLRDESNYELRGRIATVENPTAFTRFEKLGGEIPLALYTRGCFSKRVLRWLTNQAESGLEIVHFGDYDPVGLKEYLKLRAACGDNAYLYLPQNLRDLFQRYSNPKLLQRRKSQSVLQRLRKTDDVSVLKVVKLIEETNGGLEQEALLL